MSGLKKSTRAKKWLRSERYINREYSWLQFNKRVLDEAANPRNPLLERLKFLGIFESNLDEFYMVRVSGLIEQLDSGVFELSPDGMSPGEQLTLISQAAAALRKSAGELWLEKLKPQLAENNIFLHNYADLSDRQKHALQKVFAEEIFPICTPLILCPAPTMPFISNRSLNLAVVLQDENGNEKIARVKIPNVTRRAIPVHRKRHEYILVEDLIRNNLQGLFPGVHIGGAYAFRVIRDADVEIRELEAEDLIDTIEKSLQLRRFGDPVLLEVSSAMPEHVRDTLMRLLELEPKDVFVLDGLLGFDFFFELAELDNNPALRYPTFSPALPEQLSTSRSLFETVASGDVLVHQPFDSFRSVQSLVDSAATDPDVIGIKQTLYRVGAESPIVDSLLAAAEAGKQVAVMVELKARFDESNNLVWAKALERAGVHITFGIPELKTHCKLCMVVRREGGGIHTFVHIGTGNYNPSTARVYTDLGLFTTDPDITQDVAELFNYLTGFSKQREYRKLLVAPINLSEGVIRRIHREASMFKKTGQGRIVMKLNALVDPEVIEALYSAAQVGVQIDLIVRGICALRPGLPDLSPNVRVLSVVGRFLEHSRILYFENGGSPEVFIGSADMMRRNLHRRVEVMVPVERPELIAHIRDEILENYLRDTTNTWMMQADGSYKRRAAGSPEFSVQQYFTENPTGKTLFRSE